MGSHTQFSKLKSSKEAAQCLPHQKTIGGETQHKVREVDTVVGLPVLQIVILVDHLVGVQVHQQVTRMLLLWCSGGSSSSGWGGGGSSGGYTSPFAGSSNNNLPKFSDTFCSSSGENCFKFGGASRQNSNENNLFGDPKKKLDWDGLVDN